MFLPSLLFSLLTAPAIWIMTRRHPARDPRVVAAILFLLILLPALSHLPKISVTLPQAEIGTPAASWILLAWLAGFSFFFLKALLDQAAMIRWRKCSTPLGNHALIDECRETLGFDQLVQIHIHPALNSPVVAGLVTPTIYLPESSDRWSEKTLRIALLHELSHVQRRDLWMATLAHLACLLHWFNPTVWWMRRTVLTQCEFACDSHLLSRGADPKTYAHALCDVAEASAHPPLALAMAGHVPLRQRIQHIGSPQTKRSPLFPFFVLVTSASAIAMSLVKFVPEILPAYTLHEIELRFNASPFPGDRSG